MGLLRSVLRPTEQKAAASRMPFGAIRGGQEPVYTQWDHRKAVTGGYAVNPTVYACIRAISSEASTVPWVVETRRRDGAWAPAPDHELQRLVDRPLHQVSGVHLRLSRQDLMEAIIVYLHLTGEAPVLALDEDTRTKRPAGLYPVRPDRITPLDDYKAILGGYEYTPPGASTAIPLKPYDIIMHKFFNPLEQLRGQGSLQPAARTVDTENSAQDWRHWAFHNRLTPDGAFTFAENLTDEQYEKLKEQIESKEGPRNARKVLILEGGGQYTQMMVNAVDMDYLGGSEHGMLQICQVFRTPPEVIGSAKYKAYNSQEQAHQAFWLHNLIPLLEDIAATWNEDLASRWYGDRADVRLVPDYTGVPALLKVLEKKTAIAQRWVGMGMPVHEADERLHMNLPRFEGDDKARPQASPSPPTQSTGTGG